MPKCDTCKANKVCDHNIYGFENCGNYIPEDVVKVVRCKDCAHWGGVTFGFICRKYSGDSEKICTGNDHFCSYGERKDVEKSDR